MTSTVKQFFKAFSLLFSVVLMMIVEAERPARYQIIDACGDPGWGPFHDQALGFITGQEILYKFN